MSVIFELSEKIERKRAYIIIALVVLVLAVALLSAKWVPVTVAFVAMTIVLMSGYSGLILLIIWIAVQNTVIPIFYSSFGGDSNIWIAALAASELTAIFMVLKRLPKYFDTWVVSKWWVISAVAYAVASAIVLGTYRASSLFSALYNERMLLIPILFFILGYLYSNENRFESFLKAISVLTIIGAILGLVDAFLLGSNFWLSMHMGNYWTHIKHLSSADLFRGLPGNFYESYGGVLLRRAVSFYGDPLAAGYSMSIGFGVLLYLIERVKKYKWLWIVGIAIVLIGIAVTYTRAAYIMAAVEFLFFYFYRRKIKRPIPKLIILPIVLVFLLIAGKVIISTLTLQNGSAQIHLHAFGRVPYMLLHPFGFGVGASGGPEGAYFQILWQYGLIILALFIWWLFASFRSILETTDWMKYMAMGIFTALLISGIFSQEMLTDTAAGLGWTIIGLSTGLNRAPNEDIYHKTLWS